MCVAFAVPEGVDFPDLDDLLDMENANPDGAGIAWVDNNEVHWLKGLEARELHDLGHQLPGPKICHFRLATAGGRSMELTHPFPVEKAPRTSLSGRAKRVMIHNGHISDWEFYAQISGPLPGGEWSDTRLVARFLALHGPKILREFSGQRFATLDRKGKIQTSGTWDEMNGVHYSNLYWTWKTRYNDYHYDRHYNGSKYGSYTTSRAGQGAGKVVEVGNDNDTDDGCAALVKCPVPDYELCGDPSEVGWGVYMANKYGPASVTKKHMPSTTANVYNSGWANVGDDGDK